MSSNHYTEVEDLIGVLPSGDGRVGLDLEADSLYRYAERICLIQVCYDDEVKLVDPLNGQSVVPLVDWLRNSKVWMHGADYDMSLMLGEWDMVPPFLYDTQIAAQLLGYKRFGYAGLVEQFFDVTLSKSSQKADWGRRPLSDKMLDYACDDVRYLLPLAEALESKLKECGRYDWFLESCAAAQERVVTREAEKKEPWRIGGSGRLKSSGLRFLEAIWIWRDHEASDWNRPCFMVATNKELVEWSHLLSEGGAPVLSPRMRGDRRRRLDQAIDAAKELSENQWPLRIQRERHKYDPSFEGRLKSEIEKRNQIGEELGIEPSLIVSRAVLEQIVGGRAEASDILLGWQQSLLDLS